MNPTCTDVGLGYDQANGRMSLSYPNGTSTSYTYDIELRYNIPI